MKVNHVIPKYPFVMWTYIIDTFRLLQAPYIATSYGTCTAEATIYWQPNAKRTVLAVVR